MLKRTSSIVLSVVAAVMLACVVPVVDQPETPFNEADTPVNQATVIAPIRVAPPSEMATVLPAVRANTAERTMQTVVELKALPVYSRSATEPSLLCTFLI